MLVPIPRPPTKSDLQKIVYRFEPQNESQRLALRLWSKPSTRVMIICGPAGSGKSHLAVALALRDVLDGRAESIIISRPLVECGKSMGFLPGTVEEKIAPFLVPIQSVTRRIAFNVPDSVFVPLPLNHMRGHTFQSQIAILDESQNCEYSELKLFISRMGRGSKLILTGDLDQTDIQGTESGYDCDLDAIIEDISGVKGVELVEFQDHENLRDPLLIELLQRLK